jgi:hypothetical protein
VQPDGSYVWIDRTGSVVRTLRGGAP